MDMIAAGIPLALKSMALRSNTTYFTNKIEESKDNPNALFRLTRNMMENGGETIHPVHTCKRNMTNDLSAFLYNKILNITNFNYNILKLNADKTEVIVFTSKYKQDVYNDFCIKISDTVGGCSSRVKDLGVIFDRVLLLRQHVSYTSKTCRFNLRNMSRIRNTYHIPHTTYHIPHTTYHIPHTK